MTAYLLHHLDGRTDDGRQIDRQGLREKDPVLCRLVEEIFHDKSLSVVYGKR